MCAECDQARRGGNLETHMCSKKTFTKDGALERLVRFDLRRQPSIWKRAGAAAQSAMGRFEIDGFDACVQRNTKNSSRSKSDRNGTWSEKNDGHNVSNRKKMIVMSSKASKERKPLWYLMRKSYEHYLYIKAIVVPTPSGAGRSIRRRDPA
jgi:hypothetical protein